MTLFALRVRSYFSLMEGTCSPKQLCLRAKELGFTHLALTDCNNLYGLPAFLSACKETGIHPIIGAEIRLEDEQKSSVTCLVEDQLGYSNLCSLLSARHCEPGFTFCDITCKQSKGLIFLVDDLGLLRDLHGKKLPVVADLGYRPTAQGRLLREWSFQHNIPAICTPHSSLTFQEDEDLHLLLRAIAEKTTLSGEGGAQEKQQPLESPEVYISRFSIWPEVWSATMEIGMRCKFTGPKFGVIMPPWRKGMSSIPADVLREDAYGGAQLRYGLDLSEAVVERLEYELRVIEEMGFSSYFLVVRDIIHPKDAEGVRHKRRVCGRGSGAASLVAYCLEITNVCPVRHNLYFERFLNPGRMDPPDIDIDFSWDERDDVLREILAEHKAYVAMVCNHVYFQPRMAIRETAKAFGLPGYEISSFIDCLSWFSSQGEESLQEKIGRMPGLRGAEIVEPWPTILALADRLVGIPRYLSVHPGGVVITPDKIDRYVPVEISRKGVPIIQWEKDGAEEAGLVKIDILGNRSLGVIRDTIHNLRENGEQLREESWAPEDDSRTQRAIALGRTMGCFYIESPAMRLLQEKAGSGDFEQLVIQSSIIRPAANDFVREYVRRLHGGSWPPLHEELDVVLADTFGLMVYQEDVSRVAVALAGFSHARADGLRKVLSKKDRELRLVDYKSEFYEGCAKKDISAEITDTLWRMMMSFDGYSFCKPHSASYAKVSYQAAYLKVHFPAEFMAAVISNQGGFYSCFAYVSEAKRLGLILLAPDVNKSVHNWCGVGDELRVGLLSVKGLSTETVQRILLCRGIGPFTSIADFLYRVRPAENEARALIHAGGMDSLPPQLSRTEQLWALAAFKRTEKHNSTQSLFPPSLPVAPELPPQPQIERLRYEYRVLGFLCSTHPITLFAAQTKNMVKGAKVRDFVGRKIVFAGWLLTGKIVSTKSGEAMEFLTFEDETATVEATFFPEVYKRYAHILSADRGYMLAGLVEEDFGAITLTVSTLQLLTG